MEFPALGEQMGKVSLMSRTDRIAVLEAADKWLDEIEFAARNAERHDRKRLKAEAKQLRQAVMREGDKLARQLAKKKRKDNKITEEVVGNEGSVHIPVCEVRRDEFIVERPTVGSAPDVDGGSHADSDVAGAADSGRRAAPQLPHITVAGGGAVASFLRKGNRARI